jgi:hypothetical protein
MQVIYSDGERANQYDWRTVSVFVDETDVSVGEGRWVCVINCQ